MISWTAASARRLSLQATITLAPLRARAMAVVLPMPVFAPGQEGALYEPSAAARYVYLPETSQQLLDGFS